MKYIPPKEGRDTKHYRRLFTYCIIYVVVFITALLSEHENKNALYYAMTFGVSSALYLCFYFVLKLSTIRLQSAPRLVNWINRLHIPKREIIVHLCLFLLTMTIAPLNDSDKAIVTYKKPDDNLLRVIEQKYCRNDINSIIELDGKYLIKFSDGKVEYMEIKDK